MPWFATANTATPAMIALLTRAIPDVLCRRASIRTSRCRPSQHFIAHEGRVQAQVFHVHGGLIVTVIIDGVKQLPGWHWQTYHTPKRHHEALFSGVVRPQQSPSHARHFAGDCPGSHVLARVIAGIKGGSTSDHQALAQLCCSSSLVARAVMRPNTRCMVALSSCDTSPYSRSVIRSIC